VVQQPNLVGISSLLHNIWVRVGNLVRVGIRGFDGSDYQDVGVTPGGSLKVDIGSTEAGATEAVYSQADIDASALSNVTWTVGLAAPTSPFRGLSIQSGADQTIQISFDAGTTLHMKLLPTSSVIIDLRSMALEESAGVSFRANDAAEIPVAGTRILVTGFTV